MIGLGLDGCSARVAASLHRLARRGAIMRFSFLLLCCVVLTSAACHPGPGINAGAKQPPVGGTIAGIVTTADASRQRPQTDAGGGCLRGRGATRPASPPMSTFTM